MLLTQINLLKSSKKSGILQTCRHSALDAESNAYNNLGIPAFAGMTGLSENDVLNDFFIGLIILIIRPT